MNARTYTRLFLLLLILIGCLVVYSFTRVTPRPDDSCNDGNKCDPKQSEFLIWQSITRTIPCEVE